MQTEAKAKRKARRTEEVPRPFLKYVGGKRRLLPELCKRVPKEIGRYHEPFVGGGALFFELRREGRIPSAVLSDADERLVRTWRGVRDDPDGVLAALHEHERMHSREHFECMRTVTDFATDALCAAWRIYVSKTAYNGLYRVNRQGMLNAPFGDYADPKILDEENLRACSRALQGVELVCGDFSSIEGESLLDRDPEALRALGAFDEVFFYFDSPYKPVTKTRSFTGYGPGGFTDDDQRRLAEHAAMLKRSGAKVLLTNSDAPLVRELYPEPFWKVERVEARGDAVNCKAEGRGKVAELIIS